MEYSGAHPLISRFKSKGGPSEQLAFYADSFDNTKPDLWDIAAFSQPAQHDDFEMADVTYEDGRLKIQTRVGALIHFDFDSAEIRPDSYPLLDEFGKALKGGLTDATIIVAGHTDNIGSREYNQKLSEERAKSVKKYLLDQHGIESKRITINGFGETKPIATNDTDGGRLKNRRVEFIRIR